VSPVIRVGLQIHPWGDDRCPIGQGCADPERRDASGQPDVEPADVVRGGGARRRFAVLHFDPGLLWWYQLACNGIGNVMPSYQVHDSDVAEFDVTKLIE
jgi:hypothetical protein